MSTAPVDGAHARTLDLDRMKRLPGALLLLVVVLATVALVRSARFASRQPAVDPVARLPLDAGRLAGRLAEAVRFRTVSPQDPAQRDDDAFRGLRRWLETTFPRVHAALAHEVVAEHSLLFTWPGRDSARRPILLMAHMDVVPVEPGTEDAWTEPPFEGRIADGFVWGRGTLDDKAGLVATFEAIELLLGEGFQPTRSIYLAFGHDEEVGGTAGAASVAALLRARGVAFHWVADEGGTVTSGLVSGLDAPAALVGIAEKGILSVEITAAAEGGHSSMPPPHTAVGMIGAAVARLEKRQLPGRLAGPSRSLFEWVGPEMHLGPRMAFANLWLFAPLVRRQLAGSPSTNAMLRTTTAPTMLSGGVKENVLPSEARAVVNFRVLPGDTVATVLEHVRQTVDEPRITVRALGTPWEPSPVSSPDAPSFGALARTIRRVLPGVVVAPWLVVGATDSRHYAPLTGATYRFRPWHMGREDLARVHGTNERIGVEDYADCVRFYVQLVRDAAGTP